ncbi:hypothetical protein Tco_1343634 [Tanacetum coccineum]
MAPVVDDGKLSARRAKHQKNKALSTAEGGYSKIGGDSVRSSISWPHDISPHLSIHRGGREIEKPEAERNPIPPIKSAELIVLPSSSSASTPDKRRHHHHTSLPRSKDSQIGLSLSQSSLSPLAQSLDPTPVTYPGDSQ